MRFNAFAKLFKLFSIQCGMCLIAAAFADRNEGFNAYHQHKRQQHALAAVSDTVHTIVPVPSSHERKSVLSKSEAAFNSLKAMFIHAHNDIRVFHRAVNISFTLRELHLRKKAHFFIEQRIISCRTDIFRGCVRQKEPVIAYGCAHAHYLRPITPGNFMPPVQHIAMLKLH